VFGNSLVCDMVSFSSELVRQHLCFEAARSWCVLAKKFRSCPRYIKGKVWHNHDQRKVRVQPPVARVQSLAMCRYDLDIVAEYLFYFT
jgi:hypothetical protein